MSVDPPPIAKREPRENERHGFKWVDDYAWLKDVDYPKVQQPEILAYLEAENAYFRSLMHPHRALTKQIFEELKSRVQQDDVSVPVKDGAWLYQWRYELGQQYRRWYRVPVGGGAEQLLLDETDRAEGLDFYRLGAFCVSDDGRYLAWSEDTNGGERFTLRFKDLSDGRVLEDTIPETSSNPVWADDGRSILYIVLNNEWRPYRVCHHILGDDPKNDRVVYEESDAGFFVGISKSQSRRWVFIQSGDHVTSEVRAIPSDSFTNAPTLVRERKPGHQYELDHAHGEFFVRTNDIHENFRLVRAPEYKPTEWQEVVGASDSVYIRGFSSFEGFLALQERVDGLDQIRIRGYDGDEHRVAFPEASYTAHLGSNPEFAVRALRLGYESMVTPTTVYDYDLEDRSLSVRKVQEIPSGYDAKNYVTERFVAPARDGAQVPVSIVYRRDFVRGGDAPLHLYGYGAYGIGMSPSFSSNRISLLDRGFAYAIAHIRGGDEMGYGWYTAGKLDKRTNTFNDFVDVARFLIRERFVQQGRITASGGSAGGGLMGAVANQAPELFAGIVAHVPFVDVLNTMLDTSLPLTPMEWPEWGNPIEDAEAFHLIRSYSPYDNVEAKHYPPLMITGGLNDPRVTYWEPAKWAARLRATKTDSNLLVLKINMEAGHAGKTGRFVRLQEIAEEYTFLAIVTGLAS